MDRSAIRWGALCAAALAATAGGAEAARDLLTGSDVKDGSLGSNEFSGKARTALKAARGARGRAGTAGATGAAGQAGVAGATGATGANGRDGRPGTPGTKGDATLTFRAGSMTTGFFAGPQGSDFSDETFVQFPVPAGSHSVKRLAIGTVFGNGPTVTLRVNRIDTALQCVMPAASAPTSCSVTGSVSVGATDLLSLGITGSGKSSTSVVVLTFGP